MHDKACLMNIKNEYWNKNRKILRVQRKRGWKRIIPRRWSDVFWGKLMYCKGGDVNKAERIVEFIVDTFLEMLMEDLVDGKAFQFPHLNGGFIFIGRVTFPPKVKEYWKREGRQYYARKYTKVVKDTLVYVHEDFNRGARRWKRFRFILEKKWRQKAFEKKEKGFKYQLAMINHGK